MIDLTIEEIRTMWSGEVYENLYVNKEILLKFVCLSEYGIVFLSEDTYDPNVVMSHFSVTAEQSFFFFQNVFSHDGETTEVFDLAEALATLNENLTLSKTDRMHLKLHGIAFVEPTYDPYEEEDVAETFSVDGEEYEMQNPYYFEDTGDNSLGVVLIDEKTIKRLDAMLQTMENNEKPDPKAKRKIVDGEEFVKKYAPGKLGFVDTGLMGKEDWFRVDSGNTDLLCIFTALFGWSGYHRFKFGEIVPGIFYFLTCGCLGVLPAFDLLTLVLGNANYTLTTYEDGADFIRHRERVYLKRPQMIWMGIIAIFLSVLVSYCVFRFGYMAVITYVSRAISGFVKSQI